MPSPAFLHSSNNGPPHSRTSTKPPPVQATTMLPLQYIDHPSFPSTAPLNHPHILNSEANNSSVPTKNLCLCDAIATLLHNLESKLPGALEALLNTAVKSFKFTRLSNRGEGGVMNPQMDLMIWREGPLVIAGFFNKFPDSIEWEAVTKATIQANGRWHATWGARAAYTKHPLEGSFPLESLSPRGFLQINSPLFLDCNPYRRKEAREVHRSLGEAIYGNKLWEDDDDPLFQVVVDGKEIRERKGGGGSRGTDRCAFVAPRDHEGRY
ncbi:hypothetical protein BU26DRAFT_608730 [Trematosphaeria pertusa]|uniref:Uncharacterized protein n=1 Tax=Trematosphaeria pertusa TaxID=390896 RepID=A0A6A6I1X8_9PLEO|nr:uncharacterized protein BU26DRAFT_608730 [Trematosphaeria pertusa]KAF2244286.1 hypothetical protein BU26DRAFT_608730 [Trematosphaeria pertusa]